MFDTVLIANRGEIALRVIRACREEGLRSVAVYSSPDQEAPHVLAADQAVALGGATPAESYLSERLLLKAAADTGAGAIHPGYGFLAESAKFARSVEDANLTFIGPPSTAIEEMGDKPRARARMVTAGVPVVPGSGELSSIASAREAAEEIGFPIMIKAAAGGGGKGMHVVRNPSDLTAAFERAQREAEGAFGDSRIYLERFLLGPRHIEIQILADENRTLHLGERECSIQRRHQKLIEEAPSPCVDQVLRERLGAVAVRAAEAVGYLGAGTVEFLLEGSDFFFLEMNTRIQVEHPVTEMITGVDLVREQLRIALGYPALDGLDAPSPRGHALECRISAEDPQKDFLPSVGRVESLEIPMGPGIRWDGGIRVGFEVGLHYDPLLGKLIVHAENRARAIERMQVALEELWVDGLETTQAYHLSVLSEEDFRAGTLSIEYVQEHPELLRSVPPDLRKVAIATAVLCENHLDHEASLRVINNKKVVNRQLSPWVQAGREW